MYCWKLLSSFIIDDRDRVYCRVKGVFVQFHLSRRSNVPDKGCSSCSLGRFGFPLSGEYFDYKIISSKTLDHKIWTGLAYDIVILP